MCCAWAACHNLDQVERPGDDAAVDVAGPKDRGPDSDQKSPLPDTAHDGPVKPVDGPVKQDGGPIAPKGVCINGGWCWQNPLPQGHSLRGLWATSATRAVAVGEHGTLLHLQKGQWLGADCGTLEHLNAVWGSSATDVWAVGAKGTVVFFDGVKCTKMPSATNADLYGVFGTGASASWAVGTKGAVLFNGGAGFTYLTSCGSTKTLRAVWGAGATDPHVAGHDGALFKLAGKTCTPISIPSKDHLYALWGSSPTNIYAAGAQGTMLRYTGKWKAVQQFANEDLVALWGVGPSEIYAVGKALTTAKGSVIYRGAAGKWSSDTNHTQVLGAVHGAGKVVRSVGELGTMLRRDAGGWKQTSRTLQTNSFYAIAGNSSTDLMATGSLGTAAHFDGTTWTSSKTGTTKPRLFDISAGGGATYYAVGDIESVGYYPSMLYFNGGSWAAVPLPISKNFIVRGIWAKGTSRFAAGYDLNKKTVLILKETGKTWQRVSSSNQTQAHAVWGRSATDIYIVGKGALRRDATGWSALSPPSGYCTYFEDVWSVGPSTVFFVGYKQYYLGCAMRLTDGKIWKAQKIPVHLKALWGTSPTSVYAVGSKGGYYQFDGTQWKKLPMGTGVDLWDIWGTSATNVYIVGVNGTILHKGK